MKPTVGEESRVIKGKFRIQPEKTRQTDLLAALSADPVTERHVLGQVGDTRYTRELLRKLINMNIVERIGQGGAHDPFRYRLSRCLKSLDFSNVLDPVLEKRMKKIEQSIINLLHKDPTASFPERYIRNAIGDNTGTGKALRRLVRSSLVSTLSGRLFLHADI